MLSVDISSKMMLPVSTPRSSGFQPILPLYVETRSWRDCYMLMAPQCMDPQYRLQLEGTYEALESGESQSNGSDSQ
jgi:hypothetical protein